MRPPPKLANFISGLRYFGATSLVQLACSR
jgi:hypothetical protein